MTEDLQLPITALVLSRSQELGLSRTQLVRLAGYTNTAKGLRRLEQLCEGEFRSTRGLIEGLPSVLEVPADVVAKAVEDTQRHFREIEEERWRANFKPHAIIFTERRVPEPIFIAALVGVDQLLRIDLDLTAGPVSFPVQTLEGIRNRLARHAYPHSSGAIRWKSVALKRRAA